MTAIRSDGLAGAVLIAFAALAALPTTAHAQSPRDPAAEARLARWIEAAGGPRVWDSVRNLRYTITTIWYDSTGIEQRRRPRYVWVDKDDDGFRVRVERTEREGKYVQVWDGKAGWATLDGSMVPDTARPWREVLYVAGDLTYWIGLPWKLRDPGVNLRAFERDEFGKGPGFSVTFGSGTGEHPGDRYWYYFGAPDSAFPTEVHYIEEGRPDTNRDRVRFDEWGNINGARYNTRRTLVDAQGRALRSLVLTDVVPNKGVSSSLFKKQQP